MFRPRFRLITLLAVMTLIAIIAGAFGIYRRAVMAEDLAYRKISKQGGWIVVYSHDSYVEFFSTPTQPILDCGTGVERTYPPTGTANDFGDDDLALFDSVPRVCTINLKNTRVTFPAAIRFAERHPNWEVYYLNDSLSGD